MSRRTRTGYELRVIPGGADETDRSVPQAGDEAADDDVDGAKAGREHERLDPAHIEGMTTMTPAKQTASIAASRRAEAATAGRPLRRTYRRGMLLAGRVRWFLFVDNGKLMASEFDVAAAGYESVTFDGLALNVPTVLSTKRVDFDLLEIIVANAHDADKKPVSVAGFEAFKLNESVPSISVFADVTAFRMARKIAGAADKKSASGDFRGKTVSMILDFRRMLPNSGHLPILTESLERAYWLPSGADVDNADEWSDSFGFTGSSPRRIALLMTAALCGPTHDKYAGEVIASEKYGTASARYSGSMSATKAFRRLNKVANASQALVDSDPLLAELHTHSGVTTRLTLMKSKARGSARVFAVSDGFKMKRGAKVLIFDPASPDTKPSECTIKEIGVDPVMERVCITVTKPTHGDGQMLFEMAEANSRPLYAAVAPYIAFGKPTVVTGRWMSKGTDRPQRLDVPIDVALAGAPDVS